MGVILLTSIILGILVGLIIFYLFSFKVIFRGPNSKDIIGQVFFNKNDGKFYKLEPKIYLCCK